MFITMFIIHPRTVVFIGINFIILSIGNYLSFVLLRRVLKTQNVVLLQTERIDLDSDF